MLRASRYRPSRRLIGTSTATTIRPRPLRDPRSRPSSGFHHDKLAHSNGRAGSCGAAVERSGLDPSDAQARLARNGLNVLPSIPATPVHEICLRQFRSVVVLLLIGAAAVAFMTGDTADAFAICAVLVINVALGFGVEMRASLDGREIDRLSDSELEKRIEPVVVFSRISPEAKLRIVGAYHRRDEVVAMLGDGVNHAAALRRADVGVTMGARGTDVARETAAVVLQDDRFSTIGVAIEEGRVIYDNIRKFISICSAATWRRSWCCSVRPRSACRCPWNPFRSCG